MCISKHLKVHPIQLIQLPHYTPSQLTKIQPSPVTPTTAMLAGCPTVKLDPGHLTQEMKILLQSLQPGYDSVGGIAVSTLGDEWSPVAIKITGAIGAEEKR